MNDIESLSKQVVELEKIVNSMHRMMRRARAWSLIRFFVITVLPVALFIIYGLPWVNTIQETVESALTSVNAVSGGAGSLQGSSGALGATGFSVEGLCKQFCSR